MTTSRGWIARAEAERTLPTRAKARTHIRPKVGRVRLDHRAAEQLGDWLHALAKAHPRLRSKVGKPARHRAVDPECKRAPPSAAIRVFGI
jgi:hypothetical protein